MKQTLRIGMLTSCLCLGMQSLYAVDADTVKAKLLSAYNTIDTFVSEKEAEAGPSEDFVAADYARLHHKVIRKIIHWIAAGNQYAADFSPLYIKVGEVINLLYVALQETHSLDATAFKDTYGFSLDEISPSAYTPAEISSIGEFISNTGLWQTGDGVLALCNQWFQSRA